MDLNDTCALLIFDIYHFPDINKGLGMVFDKSNCDLIFFRYDFKSIASNVWTGTEGGQIIKDFKFHPKGEYRNKAKHLNKTEQIREELFECTCTLKCLNLRW